MGWYRKIRRRRGGVYLWRVDHYRSRARRHNGYVGETVNFYLRSRQHLGLTAPGQPWSDLRPVRHDIIKLPWWLCWKWVLRPLETLVILATWPVYNHAKNQWNPRRITISMAKVHRLQRDRGRTPAVYRAGIALARLGRGIVLLAGAFLVLVGLYGWITTL